MIDKCKLPSTTQRLTVPSASTGLCLVLWDGRCTTRFCSTAKVSAEHVLKHHRIVVLSCSKTYAWRSSTDCPQVFQAVKLQCGYMVTMHYGPAVADAAPKGFLIFSHESTPDSLACCPTEKAINSWNVILSNFQQKHIHKWRWWCCLMRDTAAC